MLTRIGNAIVDIDERYQPRNGNHHWLPPPIGRSAAVRGGSAPRR
jgi:hypothetical protein